jgi:hypothetical protein
MLGECSRWFGACDVLAIAGTTRDESLMMMGCGGSKKTDNVPSSRFGGKTRNVAFPFSSGATGVRHRSCTDAARTDKAQ